MIYLHDFIAHSSAHSGPMASQLVYTASSPTVDRVGKAKIISESFSRFPSHTAGASELSAGSNASESSANNNWLANFVDVVVSQPNPLETR